MKINFLVIALLSACSAPLFGIDLIKSKMPSELQLKEQLKAHRFFVEKTQIISQIAEKELHALQVIAMVTSSINDFAKKYPTTPEQKEFYTEEDIKHLKAISLLEGQKATVIEKLLKVFPSAERAKVQKLLRAKL